MLKRVLIFTLFLFTSFCYAETTPPTPAPAAPTESAQPAAEPFAIASSAFLDEGALPVLYTCDGKDISPELSWTHAPSTTQSFALIMLDKDVPNTSFYHWAIYNMPAKTTMLEEGVKKLPKDAHILKNNFAKSNYTGPCPPKGTSHSYVFTLYALDAKLTLENTADVKALLTEIEKHTLGKVTITAVYSRWLN